MNAFLIHNLYYVLNFEGEDDRFRKRFHIYVAITIMFSTIILVYASTDISNQINIGFMGVCGVAKASSVQFVSIVFLLIILPFCLYVLVNSLKHYKMIQKESKNAMDSSKKQFENENQKTYLFLNISYMILFIVDCLPITILNFINWWCHFYIHCEDHTVFREILETLSLILLSGNSFFLFLIRSREPTLRKFFIKVFKWKKPIRHKEKSLKKKLLDKALIKSRLNGGNLEEEEQKNSSPSYDNSHKISLQRSPAPENEDKYLSFLQIFFLLRVLLLKQLGMHDKRFFSSCESPFGEISKSGINIDEINKSGINNQNNEEKIPWANHFYTKFDVEIYDMNKMLGEISDEHEQALFSIDKTESSSKFHMITAITYCKRLFTWLRDNRFYVPIKYIVDSLDLHNNQAIISKNCKKKTSYHEFVSFDNKLVIAVISKEIKKFLLDEFFKEYHEYLSKKQYTFLPRFLGLYSFQLQRENSNISQSYSILIYENPFLEHNLYKTKEILEHPPKEILAIYYVQAEKIKKKSVYKCEDDENYDIEHYDLRMNSEDKSLMLAILYEDLGFLTKIGVYNYRFCLIYFKFEDQFLIESTLKAKETEKNMKKWKHQQNNKFYLENRVGFCVGTIRNMFKFLKRKKKGKKEKMKFDVAINKEVSVSNPNNYGRFLYEQAQDL